MKKGKFEIVLCFYAVLAFILAFLRMQTPLFLLLGFVVLAEQDEWTVKQVLQALLLSIVGSVIYNLEGILDLVTMIPFLGSALHTVFNVIDGFVNILVFIFMIIGIINVSKEKDANIPVFHNFAEWAYGKIVKKVTYQQPVNNMQFQGQNTGMNGQNMQYGQPANNMQFQGQAPMQNMQYGQPTNNMQFQGQAPMNGGFTQNNENISANEQVTNDSTQQPNA